MHTLHVVTEIPVAGKAISEDASFTTIIGAKEGLVAVSMHGVGLTLVSEETGRGRKVEVLTSNDLAPVGLEMRIHEFTDANGVVSMDTEAIGEVKWSYS